MGIFLAVGIFFLQVEIVKVYTQIFHILFYFAASHEIGCGSQVDVNTKLHISHAGS